MRVLSSAFQEHLSSGATTLCWCWRITRRDETELGFTDHDRDIAFDGTSFEASTGFTATEIDGSVGLDVDNLDVEGALASDRLTEDDLSAGAFDNAVIEIFRVNWADPEQRVLIRYGNLGEVTRGAISFKAEVRGLAHVLQQTQGRVIQAPCDADLGDARCTINLEGPAFKGSGSVTAIADQRTFTVSGLADFASDWFTRGNMTWTSGANQGRKAELKRHARSPDTEDGTVTLELWQAMSDEVAGSDAFTLTAGCDKSFAVCQAKFANKDNFRGFPHVPGNDFALSVAQKGKNNDGGSTNS